MAEAGIGNMKKPPDFEGDSTREQIRRLLRTDISYSFLLHQNVEVIVSRLMKISNDSLFSNMRDPELPS